MPRTSWPRSTPSAGRPRAGGSWSGGRDDLADGRHQADGLPVQGAAPGRPRLPGDRLRHGRDLPLRAPARPADRRRRAVPDRPRPHAGLLPRRRPLPGPSPGPGDRQRRPQLRPPVPRDLRHDRRRPRAADRERRLGGPLHPRVPDRGQGPPAARRGVHALDPLRPAARRLQGARPDLRRRVRPRPAGPLAGPARGVHVRLRRPARVHRGQHPAGPRRPPPCAT